MKLLQIAGGLLLLIVAVTIGFNICHIHITDTKDLPREENRDRRNTNVDSDTARALHLCLGDVENLQQKLGDSEAEVRALREQLKVARTESKEKKSPTEKPHCPILNADKVEPKMEAGALYQHVYKLEKDDPIPLVGKYFFPWRARLGVKYARILGEFPEISRNNTKKCRTLDVIFMRPNQQRCTMIIDQQNIWKESFLAPNIMSFRMDTETGIPLLNTNRVEENDKSISKHYDDMKNRDSRLVPFLTNQKVMADELNRLLGYKQGDKREPLLVMATNDGHAAMAINFFCGLKKHNITIPKHVVFAATKSLARRLSELGIKSYWHEGLGQFPTDAAKVYGDRAFGIMMMLKQFSVQVALWAGWDVVFQDVDVTWVANPIPDLVKGAQYHHAQFQDDGGRGAVFFPYAANSGFFYLRNDRLIRTFWDHVTVMMPGNPGGNQIVVNQLLELYSRRFEMNVRILTREEYPSGRFIDHPLAKPNGVTPVHDDAMVLHFCWTHNITHKVYKMKAYNELHVSDACIYNTEFCGDKGPMKDWKDMCIDLKS